VGPEPPDAKPLVFPRKKKWVNAFEVTVRALHRNEDHTSRYRDGERDREREREKEKEREQRAKEKKKQQRGRRTERK